MQFDEALGILTAGSQATTAAIAQATRVLQETPDDVAIAGLTRIAFMAESPRESREAALVLLRSRVMTWGAGDSEVRRAADQQLSAALSSEEMLADSRLALKVVNVITGALTATAMCKEETSWPVLRQAVTALRTAPQTRECPPRLFLALELYRSLQMDSWGNQVVDVDAAACGLILAGLRSPEAKIRMSASHAAGALLENCMLANTVNSDCQQLFATLMRVALNLVKTSVDTEETTTILNIIMNTADCRGAATRDRKPAALWDSDSCNLLTEALALGHASQWINNPSTNKAEAAKTAQCLMNLAVSATLGSSDPLLLVAWEFVTDHLRLDTCYSADTAVDTIVAWELARDNEADVLESELPDGAPDLSVIAWEQLDRMLSSLKVTAARSVAVPAADRFLGSQSLLDQYCGWIILSTLLPTGLRGLQERDVLSGLQRWEAAVAYMAPPGSGQVTAFQAARVRWASLMFMHEVLEVMPTVVHVETRAIPFAVELVKIARIETVPRVKAKSLGLFIQFAQLLEGTTRDNGSEAVPQLLHDALTQWFVPALSTGSVLSGCASVTGRSLMAAGEAAAKQEVYLKTLLMAAISSCMPHLDGQLPILYAPVYEFALKLLKAAGTGDVDLAEGALDLASRCIEIAGVELLSDTCAAELLRARTDAVGLLKVMIAVSGARSGSIATSSATFERTLLQAAARCLSVGDPAVLKPEAQTLLRAVAEKLQSDQAIKLLPPTTAAGDQSAEQGDSTTTLVVATSSGEKTTVNINTTLVEEQIGGLSFIGVTAGRLWDSLNASEQEQLVLLVAECTHKSPFSIVRKTGIEAIKEICENAATSVGEAAKNAPSVRNTGRRPEPGPLLADTEFTCRLQQYLRVLNIGLKLGKAVLEKRRADDSEDEGLLYAMADMCDGAKDAAALLGCPLSELPESQAAMLGVTALRWVGEIAGFFADVAVSLKTALEQDSVERDQRDDADEDEDERGDEFGLRCDAAMQVVARTARAFGEWVGASFDANLSGFFATVMVADDMSVVARTAAICVFANYLETIRGGSVAATEVMPVALLCCRAQALDHRVETAARRVLPQLSQGRPPADWAADQVEDVLDAAIRQAAPHEDPDDLTEGLGASCMRLQAACFCVGAAAGAFNDSQALAEFVPQIDQTFMRLIEHPLAVLPGRRVILDCLGCAVLKIIGRLPAADRQSKLFNVAGLTALLQLLFPLVDDQEDACTAHDLLINWVLDGPQGPALPSLFGITENQVVNPETPLISLRREVARVLEQLASNQSLVSLASRISGRLDRARVALKAIC